MLSKASSVLVIVLLILCTQQTRLGVLNCRLHLSRQDEFGTRVKMRDGVELSVDILPSDIAAGSRSFCRELPITKSTARGGNVELGRYFAGAVRLCSHGRARPRRFGWQVRSVPQRGPAATTP